MKMSVRPLTTTEDGYIQRPDDLWQLFGYLDGVPLRTNVNIFLSLFFDSLFKMGLVIDVV